MINYLFSNVQLIFKLGEDDGVIVRERKLNM